MSTRYDRHSFNGWNDGNDPNIIRWNDNGTLVVTWTKPFILNNPNLGTGVQSVSVKRISSLMSDIPTNVYLNPLDTIYYGDVLEITATPEQYYEINETNPQTITVSGDVTPTFTATLQTGDIYVYCNANVARITITYINASGTQVSERVTGNSQVHALIGTTYSWTAAGTTGYTVTPNSGSGTVQAGEVIVAPTASRTQVTIAFGKGGSNYGSWESISKIAYYGDIIERINDTINCYKYDDNTIRWTNTFTNGSATGYTYSVAYSTITSPITDNQIITATTSRTANIYNINYTMNGGTHSGTYATTYTFSESSQIKAIGSASKTGYSMSSVTTSVGSISGGTLTIPASTIGNITITYNWTANRYPVTITAGTGIATVYLSTNINATSGSASGAYFAYNSTVYGFAILLEGYHKPTANPAWVLVSGTDGQAGAIYRIKGMTVNSTSGIDFGTINAVINTYTLTINVPSHITRIYYKVNGASNWSNTTVTTTVSFNYGTSIYWYAVAESGYRTTYNSSSNYATITTPNASTSITPDVVQEFTITFAKAGVSTGGWVESGSSVSSKIALNGDKLIRSGNYVYCYIGTSSTVRWIVYFSYSSSTYNVSYSTITTPVSANQTITATTSKKTYTVSWTNKETGYISIYSRTSQSTPTSGNPSGTAYEIGTTVYVYARLTVNELNMAKWINKNWVLVSGTKGAKNSIYLIRTINSISSTQNLGEIWAHYYNTRIDVSIHHNRATVTIYNDAPTNAELYTEVEYESSTGDGQTSNFDDLNASSSASFEVVTDASEFTYFYAVVEVSNKSYEYPDVPSVWEM